MRRSRLQRLTMASSFSLRIPRRLVGDVEALQMQDLSANPPLLNRCSHRIKDETAFRRVRPGSPSLPSSSPPLRSLIKSAVPPVLPGRQSNFENSGSIPLSVALVLSNLVVERPSSYGSCFCFSPVAIRPL